MVKSDDVEHGKAQLSKAYDVVLDVVLFFFSCEYKKNR